MLPDDDAVARIGEGLIAATLPKPEWTHAAHVAAAVYLVSARPDLHPERDMPGIIQRYNVATGVVNSDTGGYHHSITLASIAAVRAGLVPGLGLAAQTNALLAGMMGDKFWPEQFWSRETLFSVPARRGWVAPDTAPLPFPVALG